MDLNTEMAQMEPLMEQPDLFGYGAGASSRTRTGDLLITNQLLYQLSYAGSLSLGLVTGTTIYHNPLSLVKESYRR